MPANCRGLSARLVSVCVTWFLRGLPAGALRALTCCYVAMLRCYVVLLIALCMWPNRPCRFTQWGQAGLGWQAWQKAVSVMGRGRYRHWGDLLGCNTNRLMRTTNPLELLRYFQSTSHLMRTTNPIELLRYFQSTSHLMRTTNPIELLRYFQSLTVAQTGDDSHHQQSTASRSKLYVRPIRSQTGKVIFFKKCCEWRLEVCWWWQRAPYLQHTWLPPSVYTCTRTSTNARFVVSTFTHKPGKEQKRKYCYTIPSSSFPWHYMRPASFGGD